MSAGLTPWFPNVPQTAVGLTLTHATPAPLIFQSSRLFPTSLGSSEPGIPFWPRCHAFCRGGMREYKPQRLVCTCASECSGTHSHPCHSSTPNFPELRVYYRTPLGLVNLGLHFGRVVMRFVELACVRASLTPYLAHVTLTQLKLTLTHTTPASVVSRSCASIPKLPWV